MASVIIAIPSPNLLDETLNSCSFENDSDIHELVKALVKNIQWSAENATNLLKVLFKRIEKKEDRVNAQLWMKTVLHSIQINYITPQLKVEEGKTITELINDKYKSDDDISSALERLSQIEKDIEEIFEEIRQQPLNQTDESVLHKVKDIVSSVHKCPSAPSGPDPDGLKKILSELCKAVKTTKKWEPRLTQMVSWCLLALSESGWLIQVGTGEGKSCIVAMFAAYRARKGHNVDILSSSSVLAERDLEEWHHFYKKLKITVDCNTKKAEPDALKRCYKSKVVYGSAQSFAGDYLRHDFQREGVRGERHFDCAIVDEVDSLMLDKGLQMVYLSSEMPTMQHLNSLWALIWSIVNQYHHEGSEITVGPFTTFFHVILKHIHVDGDFDKFTIFQMAEDIGTIPKGSVADLRRNSDDEVLLTKIKNVDAHLLAKFMETVENTFPSCHFALHIKNDKGELEELNTREQGGENDKQRVPFLYVNSGFCGYMHSNMETVFITAEEIIKANLTFTPCNINQNIITCYIPGFLRELINSKLRVWIENAFHAKTMTLGHEYILEGDEIVPVDYSCTGVVENNMKWSDGVQQFLELKHETKMSNMSVITNFMSNVGLFQKYQGQLYGITGTLGNQLEIETLQKLYTGIKTCEIPTFKRRKLFEIEGLVTGDEEEWKQKICSVVESQIIPTSYRSPRAVLVICETINRAEAFCAALGPNVPNIKPYTNNNKDNTSVTKQNLKAGDVIVATNLAGRGTDLKVSNEVNNAGGMFVLQTFLPENARVEKQAFGRTGRQGNPGSSQLIICTNHMSETLKNIMTQLCSLIQKEEEDHVMQYNSTRAGTFQINMAKKSRDIVVSNKLYQYLKNHVPKLLKKEELFSDYVKLLEDVHTTYNDSKLHGSLVSSLNETWGMWLLMSFNEKDSTEDLKTKLQTDMQKAKQRLDNRLAPTSITHHYVLFGNALRSSDNLSESSDSYTKAMQEDRCWVAIALYNRALNTLKRKDSNYITGALEDLENAVESLEFYQNLIVNTIVYSKLATTTPLTVTNNRLDKQLTTRRQVLECLKDNINEAIGKLKRARDMGGNVSVDEKLIFFLVPIYCLIPLEDFGQPVIRLLTSDVRKRQQHLNHSSFDILKELQALQCLGMTVVFTLDTVFSLGGFLSKILKLKLQSK
ncbi:protein translocase subunit SecA-like [Osmerus eperlanus]|uniref:protein translocase subunit SecA-like n=1 Tax=Osmerus eperlanus TaxID=29151 RepID=UPI002E0FBA00